MLPLYKTFTAIAFGIYVLINVKICSGFAFAAFNIQILIIDLTNVTLGGRLRGVG